MPAAIKSPKAAHAADCQALEQLPNVGPAMAGDLKLLGIHRPADLQGRDALQLYRELERHTGHDQPQRGAGEEHVVGMSLLRYSGALQHGLECGAHQDLRL